MVKLDGVSIGWTLALMKIMGLLFLNLTNLDDPNVKIESVLINSNPYLPSWEDIISISSTLPS